MEAKYLLPMENPLITIYLLVKTQFSVYQLGVLKVKLNFQRLSLDAPVTHAIISEITKKLPPPKITVYLV